MGPLHTILRGATEFAKLGCYEFSGPVRFYLAAPIGSGRDGYLRARRVINPGCDAAKINPPPQRGPPRCPRMSSLFVPRMGGKGGMERSIGVNGIIIILYV